MKLERSDTWGKGLRPLTPPVWRVTSNFFSYGPWCFSRREAIWLWLKWGLADWFSK